MSEGEARAEGRGPVLGHEGGRSLDEGRDRELLLRGTDRGPRVGRQGCWGGSQDSGEGAPVPERSLEMEPEGVSGGRRKARGWRTGAGRRARMLLARVWEWRSPRVMVGGVFRARRSHREGLGARGAVDAQEAPRRRAALRRGQHVGRGQTHFLRGACLLRAGPGAWGERHGSRPRC